MPKPLRTIAFAAILSMGCSAFAIAQTSGGSSTAGSASLAGSYLAGRSADAAHDLPAAATFYAQALVKDPLNPLLLERATTMFLAIGDMDEALDHAARLVDLSPGNPVARMALAAQTLKAGDYDATRNHLAQIGPAPLASLTGGLLAAWTELGAGDVDMAVDTVSALTGPSWYAIFKDYHRALLLDGAGRTADALDYAAAAHDADGSALRIVDGYARILARAGDRQEAINVVTDFAGGQPLHPSARTLLATLRGGLTPEPIATTALSGAAEVLYGLGTAIGGDDGPELPAAYLQLARFLDPESILATMAVGDVLQEARRCEEAIALYELVPTEEPLRRNADIQIGNCLESLDQRVEAAAVLQQLVDANPEDFEAAMELGNVYRADGKFAQAAEAYSVGISHLADDTPGIWRIYYFRGIAYERSKQWPKAEVDFKHALELNPEQPQVLNYLGYSWVDMGENLQPALDMIRAAVDLRPNDGYIVDSLGWAYFRLERFGDAVDQLERATELQPEDPVINDHLGDALWRVGRKREAIHQWSHARDLDPDENNLPAILAKIEGGLDRAPEPSEPQPEILVVASGDSLWSLAERLYGDGHQYPLLLEANRGVISNADLILPGMELVLPPPASE